MRVLVTGGAGFIGSHVAEELCARGSEVAVLDNLSTGHRANVPVGARLYQADLRDRDATQRAILDFGPDAVSHQAAQASVAVSVRDPHLDAQVNLIGGLNLLDACTSPRAKVERLVFASTGGAIYGEVAEGSRAGEDSSPRPLSPYAIHKLAMEQLLAVYATHRGLQSSVLRYGNVYGPRQDPYGEAGVAAIFFTAVLAGRRLRINARSTPGDDGCLRDYVYVSDVAAANLLALSGDIEERIINVGTGTPTSTRELATAIMAATNRDVALEFGPPRPGDIQRSVLSPVRTLRHLGRVVPLAEGLSLTHGFFAGQGA